MKNLQVELPMIIIHLAAFDFAVVISEVMLVESTLRRLGTVRQRVSLGRPRRRWVDNIRMDLQEVGCGYMDWIELTQDRDRWRMLVSAVMNLRVP